MVYGGSFRWIFQMAAFVVLGGVIGLRHRHAVRLRTERYRYQSNSTALLSEVKRMQVDSVTMALASETLRLTLGAYKRFRAEDAASLKRLRVKLKTLKQ